MSVDFAAHQPYAGIGVAVAACHTADTDSVVVPCRNGTCHVCSVSARNDFIGIAVAGLGRPEIPAVDGLACLGVLPLPCRSSQVFVGEIDSGVHDGDYYVRVACFLLPGGEEVDVSSGLEGLVHVVGRCVMPLVLQVRVAEIHVALSVVGGRQLAGLYRSTCDGRIGRFFRYDSDAAVGFLDGRVVVQFFENFGDILAFVEFHDEPAVQSACAFQTGIFAGHVEDLFYLNIRIVEHLGACHGLCGGACSGCDTGFQLDERQSRLPGESIIRSLCGLVRTVLFRKHVVVAAGKKSHDKSHDTSQYV